MTTTSNSLQTPETTTQTKEAPKPGYKKTSLGWIPEDWEVFNLSEIGEFKNGINKEKGEFGEGAYFVNLMDVFGRTYVKDYDLGQVICTDKELTSYSLKPGDVLFVRSSVKPEGVGLTSLVINQLRNTVYSGFLIRFRQSTSVLNFQFKAYCFKAPYFRKQVLTKSTFSANTNINQESLKSLKILVPPLPEQRQIAEILSTWDRAIEKTEQLIAAKEKRKKGLMQQLLTGKVRFEDFEEEWQEFKLGDLFMERKEKGFLSLPLLAVHNERGIIYRNELDRRDTSSEDKSSYKRVAPGDISYNSMRLWQGVIGVSDKEGIVSPAYTVVTPSEEIDPLFMGYLFKLPEIVHRFWRFSQGLVSDTLNCKFPSFKQVKVIIPTDKSEQQKIASVLHACDREIEEWKEKLEKLKKQKRGMMQGLLSGNIRTLKDNYGRI